MSNGFETHGMISKLKELLQF